MIQQHSNALNIESLTDAPTEPCQVKYLRLCYLHVSYEIVHQLRENWKQEILKSFSFSKNTDEFKNGKYRAFLTYDLSIRVARLITSWVTGIHHSTHIAEGNVLRQRGEQNTIAQDIALAYREWGIL